MSYCDYCERSFSNNRSLVQHFKNSSQHEWCQRCERSFNSSSAKQQHLSNSPHHHLCTQCPLYDRPDFISYPEMRDHLQKTHYYCDSCNERFGSAARLRRHDIAVHNLCEICGNYFQTPQNLKAHGLTHMPKEVECFGCYEKFVTTSAMILHLESGYCECGIDCDVIQQLAFECYQSKYYTTSFGEKCFRCPGCNTEFSRISATLQHVESDYCQETINPGRPLGKFLHFLNIRI